MVEVHLKHRQTLKKLTKSCCLDFELLLVGQTNRWFQTPSLLYLKESAWVTEGLLDRGVLF